MTRSVQTFTVTLCSFLLFACSQSQQKPLHQDPVTPQPAPILKLFVGTYTSNESEGIYQLDFDTEKGSLSAPKLLVETSNPSYLSLSRDHNYVFAVNEGEDATVSSFGWNETRSKLIPISQQASKGDYPCYVSLNEGENMLSIANYGTGNISVYSVEDNGMIEPASASFQHTGSGPVEPNQKSPHAHCTEFMDDFLYAVDLGTDQIVSYPVGADGQVGEASAHFSLDPGDGPRHVIFHPKNKSLAFVINELSSSVVSLKVDLAQGSFEKIAKVSTLPQDYTEKSYCADIHISSDGKFLYASNRGHNSIAAFSVGNNGALEKIGITSVEGDWPRNFTLSPEEKFILVANQKSDNITVFKRDPVTGKLSFTGQELKMSKPVCLKF